MTVTSVSALSSAAVAVAVHRADSHLVRRREGAARAHHTRMAEAVHTRVGGSLADTEAAEEGPASQAGGCNHPEDSRWAEHCILQADQDQAAVGCIRHRNPVEGVDR